MISLTALLPYFPKGDSWIGLMLILCLLISAFFIKETHAAILRQIVRFAANKERGSFFDEQNEPSVYAYLWYQLQAVITIGIAIYLILFQYMDREYLVTYRYLVIGGIIGAELLFLLVKHVLYLLYGWTLIGMEGYRRWLASHRLIISVSGMLFLILDFLAIYVTINPNIILISCIIMWILVKILTLYAWIRLFSIHFCGVLLIILYFCILELLPYYILCKIAAIY